MEKAVIIIVIIVILLAIGCCIISIFQFKEKGFLLNNAYLYASKQEREHMNKTPHYRQSGIVFAFLSGFFFSLAAELITKIQLFGIIKWILIGAVIIYAIVSSIVISLKK